MPPDIRQLTMADYADVFAFWQQQDGIGLNESDTSAAIAAYLQRNPGMSFIVRDKGRVVAAVLCGHDGRRGHLHHLAVAPSHRRHGLGRLLVQRCLAQLQLHGIPKCNIEVFAANHDGHAFWQSLGFRHRADLKILQRVLT